MKKYLFLFLLLITACGGNSNSGGAVPDDSQVFNNKLPENEKAVTPKGIQVRSRTNINQALFSEMDTGLDRLFVIARTAPNNYSFTISHSEFKIWLLPRSPLCVSGPGFLVKDTELIYNGSEYDKDPDPNRSIICAAGMTIFQGINAAAPGMVVADDFGHMQAVVRYEGEHGLLFFVDQERYFATQFHPPPHPILGDGVQSLFDKPPEFQSATVGGNSVLLIK